MYVRLSRCLNHIKGTIIIIILLTGKGGRRSSDSWVWNKGD